ncbi:MAG TPA: hypothetical protein VMT58_00735 [Candidatus Binataceae bacterium]|nr:hypothetical protein [Candidatus Binataceae bacterium]
MPRKKTRRGAGSAFQQVQRQARSLLMNLRKQIRGKESELNQLKDQWSQLGSLVGQRLGLGTGGGGGGKRGGRINWRTVLSQVPKQFKASDVRAVRGLKGKRPSEIFAAITRWIDAGLVKRKSRGMYEKC